VGLDLQLAPTTRAALEAAGIGVMETPLEAARFTERFDMAIMNQMIEHLWDARGALASLHAALRPGGVLSISTPNLDGWDRRLFADGTWGGYHFPRHLNLFTAASLARLLADCGFETVTTRNLAAPLVWVASLHNALAARGHGAARWFRDSNLAVLAAATALDLTLARCGLATSNQQAVARRAA
jgi:2-polyprenyl-3-methyl-5-hydroxy-6-metoxy-1,4-benzoquinol methylase